ncbi:MAG: hypothetical protein ACREO3_02125, partial [Arenimonas sp.]
MSPKTLCFTGFPRDEDAPLEAMFDAANARFGRSWQLVGEGEAQVLVIDMDSMYGHMSWLKAHNSGRTTVGVTVAGRSETDHVVARPVTQDVLVELLATLSGQAPGAAPPAPAPALPLADVVAAAKV